MTPLRHPAYQSAPAMPRIPHSRPAGGQLVDGPATAELEQRWCQLTGMNAAAAVGSGTAALRLALLALGVGPGDEVIVPAYSCVALLNAPLSIGAVPVLADVKPNDWTLDSLDVAKRVNHRTKAAIVVNLFGVPAGTNYAWAGMPIVEDCAHGPILGRTDVSVSSFYATKLVGAGMGGIVAGNAHLVDDVCDRRDYGDQPPDGRNLNDKITEASAHRALDALHRLDDDLAERLRLTVAYERMLGRAPAIGALTRPVAASGRVWYRYTTELAQGFSAAHVVKRMKDLGVDAEQPVWDLRDCVYWLDDNEFPVAALAFDRLISLPLYPGLTDVEQARVVDALELALR